MVLSCVTFQVVNSMVVRLGCLGMGKFFGPLFLES
jgi:hypothetical protein